MNRSATCGRCLLSWPPSGSGARSTPSSTRCACREQLSPETLGAAAEDDAAAERRRRVGELLSFLTLMDGLAQRFFDSRRGLREAVDLLAKPGQRGG